MHIFSTQKGQSLLEILFAIGLFTVAVVTIGYLFIDSHISFRDSLETIQANSLASEGIAVVSALLHSDFDSLGVGTYGVVLTDGEWSTVSAPDEVGQFSRTITVSNVDLEIKLVQVEVAWTVYGVRMKQVEQTKLVADIKQTNGVGKDIVVDISGAVLNASSTELSGIGIENIGTSTVTLTGLSLQWGPAQTLFHITLDGTVIFDVASTSGVSSGEFIDTTDFALVAGGGLKLFNPIIFDGLISGTDFITTFIFSDGSRKHSLIPF